MAVSDYNRTFHKMDRLQISHVFHGPTPQDRLPIIIVRRFEDMDESLKYFQNFMEHSSDFMSEEQNYQVFTASFNNYRTVLRQKSFKEYQAFFESNYLNEWQKR